MLEGEKYYQKKSLKYSRYKFSSKAKLVKGEIPNFFDLIKKYSNKNFVVLDLGCGSGELSIELASYFKKIVGIDPIECYINTAEEDRKSRQIKNIKFIVASGKNLPFENSKFDLIISSRGPLSLNLKFFREAKRVLKNEGLLIEETIGESDKVELKKIFGRGQNYPPQGTKLDKVKEILNKKNFTMLYSKNYIYCQNYNSMETVINTLGRAPIIPDFDSDKDSDNIKKVRDQLFSEKGILLSSHRLHWVARCKK